MTGPKCFRTRNFASQPRSSSTHRLCLWRAVARFNRFSALPSMAPLLLRSNRSGRSVSTLPTIRFTRSRSVSNRRLVSHVFFPAPIPFFPLLQHSLHRMFTDRHQIDEYKRRSVSTTAQHQYRLGQVPPILILHLKRFNVINGATYVEKLQKSCSYPLVLELQRQWCSDQESRRYGLRAVVVHVGEQLSSGHYYCLVRQPNPDLPCPLWSRPTETQTSPPTTTSSTSTVASSTATTKSTTTSSSSKSTSKSNNRAKPVVKAPAKQLPSYDEIEESSEEPAEPTKVRSPPPAPKPKVKPYPFEKDTWLCLDDHRVSGLSWSQVSQSQAYLLVYERLSIA